MYEAYFEFREKPFSLLPDPAFLFLGKRHSAALSLLEYSIVNQAGFAVLTGAIGSGKTTLIRHLLEHAAQDLVVGLVSNTHRDFGDLLTWVLLAFGLDPAGKDKATRYQAFIDFLLAQYAAHRRVVLIVDEAQNLGPNALEELRLLSNINADKHQVLQTILVGQPELRELLQQPALSQFVQRIAAHFHLEPLDQAETGDYIRHRLTLAGGEPGLFDPAACALVHRYSNGIPRVINVVCDTALVYGYGAGLTRIGAELVREVVRDKVSAGLFALPQGIDAEELTEMDNRELPVVTAHAGARMNRGDTAPEPPHAEGVRETHPARMAAQPQAEAPATLPRVTGDRLRPVTDYGESTADKQGASSGPSPRAAPLGFPSSPAVTGAVSAAPQHAGRGADSRHSGEAIAADVDDENRTRTDSEHGNTEGSAATTPLSPSDTQRRSTAGKGWLRAALAIGLGLPVLYLAGQGLLERTSHTGRQAAEQTVPPAADLASVGNRDADTAPNRTPPLTAVLSAGTTDIVHPSHTAQPPPGLAPVATHSGTPEKKTAPDVHSADAHDDAHGGERTTIISATVVDWAASAGATPAATLDGHPASARVALETARVPHAAERPIGGQIPRPEDQGATEARNRAERIDLLLGLAAQALDESRLTLPEQGSAYDYYQRILELDGENEPASEGLDVIVGRYARMAESALAREDYVKAQRYVRRGLRVQPGNTKLLTLKEAVAKLGP